MNTRLFESCAALIKLNKKSIDRNIRTLMAELEHENALVAETPNGRLQRALKAFRAVKPLLTLVSTFEILPAGWRPAIVAFVQALDSLAAVGPELSASFKAGKDL